MTRLSDAESDVVFRVAAARQADRRVGVGRRAGRSRRARRWSIAWRTWKRATRGQDVPRPPFWGGFRIAPERIEFWRRAASSGCTIAKSTREGDGWKGERLFP